MSFVNVDSNVSRFNSLFVTLLVLTYLFTNNVFIMLFLVVDFAIKLFGDKNFSPVYILAKISKRAFRIKSNMIDGGAKRLAQYFGFTFMLLLFGLHFVDAWLMTLAVAAIYLTCALLDVVFDFCIGCKIYFLIKKVYPSFMN
jgi:hypothetical protein